MALLVTGIACSEETQSALLSPSAVLPIQISSLTDRVHLLGKDCVVSEWMVVLFDPWVVSSDGVTLQRTVYWERTIIEPTRGNGAACGPLTMMTIETQS